MHTHIKELTKSYKISKDSIAKIRSFLQIQLNEIWLIKRREVLTAIGIENLRMIGVEAGRIEELLPGCNNDR